MDLAEREVRLEVVAKEMRESLGDARNRQLQEMQRTVRGLQEENERLKGAYPRADLVDRLESMSVEELITLASELRQIVERRLLTPPDRLASQFTELLARPDSGTARILPRGKYVHVIARREGGAFWSFATRDNDYDREPDLMLEQGRFRSGFYGNCSGYFLSLGETPVGDVPDDPARFPDGLDEEQRGQWTFLWSDTPVGAKDTWGEFQQAAREKRLSNTIDAVHGRTYVLRSVLPGEHDLLVAFRTVDSEYEGYNLVWKVLRRWEVKRTR